MGALAAAHAQQLRPLLAHDARTRPILPGARGVPLGAAARWLEADAVHQDLAEWTLGSTGLG